MDEYGHDHDGRRPRDTYGRSTHSTVRPGENVATTYCTRAVVRQASRQDRRDAVGSVHVTIHQTTTGRHRHRQAPAMVQEDSLSRSAEAPCLGLAPSGCRCTMRGDDAGRTGTGEGAQPMEQPVRPAPGGVSWDGRRRLVRGRGGAVVGRWES
ncbi:hypothetical protein SORBI_3007G206900 [Sorghum bicolor]|uniref:Uncharacterized protein n=1 Tax=Sorghum bicolor TaxID=4558 RepID=A0A1B6PIW9_SORBI|nr:hypothetical protein SORBI_3007G206900 [Sorghum bicolor]